MPTCKNRKLKHIISYGNISTLETLIDQFKEELHKLIAISEEGAVAHDDSLRHDVKIAREMIPKLEDIVQLHIDSQKGAELEKILTEFAQRIKKCL